MRSFNVLLFYVSVAGIVGCNISAPATAPSFARVDSLSFVSRVPFIIGGWEEFNLLADIDSVNKRPYYRDDNFFEAAKCTTKQGVFAGLTPFQIKTYCQWRSELSSKAKGMWPAYCGNKFWKKVHRFDPQNSYRIEYSVASFAHYKSRDLYIPCAFSGILFADTIIKSKQASDADSTFAFFLSMKYIQR